MSNFLFELPFANTNEFDFEELFKNDNSKDLFSQMFEDNGLKNWLFEISRNDLFKNMDSSYFSSHKFNEKFSKNKQNIELSVFHINIRSLNSKLREFCTFMNIMEVDFDVIFLSEIWTYNLDFYKNILDGYTLYTDLPTLSSIGGIGVFIKTSLGFKLRNDLHLSSPKQKVENLWFEISKNDSKYIVGGIYRHPNQSIVDFSALLESNLMKISKQNRPCVIAGDINIDLSKADSDKNISNYLDNLLVHNCLPVVLLPTRITSKSATVIDHIYYYEGKKVKNDIELYSGNILSDLSDHFPNFIILRRPRNIIDLKNRPMIRLFTEKNKIKFQDKLKIINWHEKFCDSGDDVNDGFNTFLSVTKDIFDESFPLQRKSRRACKDKLWITTGLKKSSQTKFNLYKKWLSTRNPVDEENYKSYKRIYSKTLRKAEITYFNNKFDNTANSIKQLWSNLNRVCSANRKNTKNNVLIEKINIDGLDIFAPADISNAFNKYFCNVGSNLVDKLPMSSKCFTDYLFHPVQNTIFVESVTTFEVCTLLENINCNKSSGIDSISPQVLKDNRHYFSEPLAYLFNLSLSNGIVPDRFKIAKVVPLFKKGDQTVLSNYRPISLLNIYSKLLEKLVHKRLYNFLEANKSLYNYQFGFRKNHSTALALLEVMDECYENIDKNLNVVGIYFDLQKAFDTVNHEILLNKLYNYGIRGVMFNWIKNYLTNRKQFTIVNNVISEIESIDCGVPQGSVLGPLLFLVYINDISNAVKDSKLKLFADDTNMFIYGPDLHEVEIKANANLKCMETWFIANKLSLNIDKTSYSLFSSCKNKNKSHSLNLLINNQCITKVSSCKYLGIEIDECLKWDIHIDFVYKKLLKFTSIFYKVRKLLPPACLSKLYFAFVHSHIGYGIEIYANTCKSTIDKLCKLNNKLLRILLQKKMDTPVIDLYREQKTLPIPLLHEFNVLTLIFKCFHHRHLVPEVFQNYFIVNNTLHSHNTRNNSDIYTKAFNSNFGKRCLLYHGSKLWNDLPFELKQFSSINTFKQKLKNYLFEKSSL